MKPIISVIVPIYNVEEYLERCLESLVNQTFKEIEILCINDGSSDNSQIIIDNYVDRYPDRVKSFTKLNGGLADARNYGLSHAKGDFVAFIDSDDWIELTMIEEMYNLAISKNADVVVCDAQYVYDTNKKQFVSGGEFEEGNIVNNPDIIKISNSAWNKIYRRSLFDDVQFPKNLWYEDLGCIPIILAKAKNIVKIDKVFYNYFQRTGSIMHTESEKIFDIYKAIDLVHVYIDNHNISCLQEVKTLYIEHGAKLTTLRIKDYKSNRKALLSKNIQLLNKHYPNWIKDPIVNSYSFKEKIIMFLLSIKQFRLVLALYDWK